MAVRNFWVEADIDGRQTMLSGGPRSKDGGMDVTVYQRDEGQIKTAVEIKCFISRKTGKLVTVVAKNERCVAKIETDR